MRPRIASLTLVLLAGCGNDRQPTPPLGPAAFHEEPIIGTLDDVEIDRSTDPSEITWVVRTDEMEVDGAKVTFAFVVDPPRAPPGDGDEPATRGHSVTVELENATASAPRFFINGQHWDLNASVDEDESGVISYSPTVKAWIALCIAGAGSVEFRSGDRTYTLGPEHQRALFKMYQVLDRVEDDRDAVCRAWFDERRSE